MQRYRNIRVQAVIEDPVTRTSRIGAHIVQLRKYFMMNWTDGTDQRADYDAVTSGGRHNEWYQQHREPIKTAAMGKGRPGDYALAMEWAVRSGKVPTVNQATLQNYFDEHLGIDCSGFVTNYLVANGKKSDSDSVLRNTSAASYYTAGTRVNDATQVRQGDLLVWMTGNTVKTDPGHVAVVESYSAATVAGGNMRVVEATGAGGATPKLLDSMYAVEQIIPQAGAVPMILVVRRHGVSGSRVVVVRV
jgi:hypothetical protein